MYVFGGRTEEGSDLGDLAAFRISSRRWYTFQNMGPTPSPRSGHSMTAVGKSIVVVGGEPSSATNQVNDLSLVYVLDTTKIRYPNDAQIQSNTQKLQQARRPSGESASGRRPPSREGSNGPDPKRLPGGPASPTGRGASGADMSGPPPVSNGISKLPRAQGASTPSGPPPQGQPPRPTVDTTSATRRMRNTSIERIEREAAVVGPASAGSLTQSPMSREAVKEDNPITNGRRTPNQQPRSGSRADVVSADLSKSKPSRQGRGQGSVDSSTEPALKSVANRPSSPPPPTRQGSNPLSRRGSNRNSQTVALLKELDSARNRNAWYASELELARKSGYTSNATLSPVLEGRGAETFDDDDKPLIEALLAMRQELANVQSSVDKQAVLAAKQIAEAERQRDAAIREAVYAKAKMAAHSGSAASTPQTETDRSADANDHGAEMSRKLAAALNLQKEFQTNLSRAGSELAAERRARQLADETLGAAQKRMTELESYKQETSSEIERLRAELHFSQREAREQSIIAADAAAVTNLLRIEKDEFEAKYNEAAGNSEANDALDSLRKAIAMSTDIRNHLERKYDEERSQREAVESKLNKLKTEHEASTAELVAVSQRLRDTEELAERSAAEAEAHRQAVLSGLEKLTNDPSKVNRADAERIAVLQSQVGEANALVKKYQQEADAAADKLRSAEERIAGLEAYQEQSSREGVTIRRQLQSALRDTQSLQALNSDLKNQLANQQLETNAMTVQYNTLKNILGERGISPTSVSRVRGGIGARTDSPDVTRAVELERQLAEAVATHEETKQSFIAQAQETEAAYRERIVQLENDYQSAVHYVKGTEKMLKRMKEELAKSKADNTRLKNENFDLESRVGASDNSAAVDWEAERSTLETKIQTLEEEMKASSVQLDQRLAELREELDAVKNERDTATKSSEDYQERLLAQKKDLEQLQQENALVEKRAQEAEEKVNLLLDQVGTSVGNYRRRSRMNSDPNDNPPTMNGKGHARQESSEAESLYEELGDARNSAALENLASELDMLRNHWETRNKSYRLSNAFDFETSKSVDEGHGLGLSESLADWRKRLDTEEHESDDRAVKSGSGL